MRYESSITTGSENFYEISLSKLNGNTSTAGMISFAFKRGLSTNSTTVKLISNHFAAIMPHAQKKLLNGWKASLWMSFCFIIVKSSRRIGNIRTIYSWLRLFETYSCREQLCLTRRPGPDLFSCILRSTLRARHLEGGKFAKFLQALRTKFIWNFLIISLQSSWQVAVTYANPAHWTDF